MFKKSLVVVFAGCSIVLLAGCQKNTEPTFIPDPQYPVMRGGERKGIKKEGIKSGDVMGGSGRVLRSSGRDEKTRK